jgi:pimeloyl-ACP methyl ester carboxylesterase
MYIRFTNCFVISIEEMAQDTIEVLEHIGWKPDAHLVGASMGGMISMELAIARPDMLKSFTLSCTIADTTLPIVSAV